MERSARAQVLRHGIPPPSPSHPSASPPSPPPPRLYEGYNLRAKFKGHANRSTQIKASLSPSCDTVICGSDDGWVYQWAVPSGPVPSRGRGREGGPGCQIAACRSSKTPVSLPATSNPQPLCASQEKVLSYECFLAASDVVTVAMFAPERALAT